MVVDCVLGRWSASARDSRRSIEDSGLQVGKGVEVIMRYCVFIGNWFLLAAADPKHDGTTCVMRRRRQ